MDWMRAPAMTVICEEKGITLRDLVQAIMDGAETEEDVMELLDLTAKDDGVEQIPEILAIFVPVVNAWKSGAGAGGCGDGCGSCGAG